MFTPFPLIMDSFETEFHLYFNIHVRLILYSILFCPSGGNHANIVVGSTFEMKPCKLKLIMNCSSTNSSKFEWLILYLLKSWNSCISQVRVVFLMGILVLPCGGVRVGQVMDAPHLLCRGLIVCLLLHLHSLVTGGWVGIFSGDRIVYKFCGFIVI